MGRWREPRRVSKADLLEIRQKATTRTPVRSDPKLGNAWAWRPSKKAAVESSSAPRHNALSAATVNSSLKH